MSKIKKHIKKLLREGLNMNNCDCCNYFDMSSLNNYVEIEKPLYSIVSKRRWGIVEYISPKEYIYRIAAGFGMSYDDALNGGGYNETLAQKYADRMKAGEKAPIGYYKEGKEGQEGRHRAIAAMLNGCEKIPVVKITELSYDEFISLIEEWKNMSYDMLNDIFNEQGYPNGISKLGYNDLMRFIDYNL